MKCIFNNVPAQLCREITASIEARLGTSYYFDGEKERAYPHVNENQKITIIGSSVVVEGERCALWGDHHAGAMLLLKRAGLSPAEYKTSDRRLSWYETLSSYIDLAV